MLNFIWDVYQQGQINALNGRVDGVERDVAENTTPRHTAQRLEDKIDRLALICRALFELMQESGGVPEERLKQKIVEIDLRDGKADHRMTAQPKRCPKCDAMMSPHFGRCLFCGQEDDRLTSYV